MTHLRPTAMLLALLTTPALTAPAFAADGELTVFDWSGFEDPRIFQKYVDQHGAEPTFAFYGDDDEAYQKLASGFKAEVRVTRDGHTVGGTSIMGLMMLGAGQGQQILIETEGPDALVAMNALIKLVESKFGEDE